MVRYDAFISYSHAADGRLAPGIETGLEQLAKPWSKRRALNVFRDDTGLSVDPALWSSIRKALDESEWFILLASPQAAGSEWVNREVARWIETRSPDRILPVVTDGSWAWDDVAGDLDWDLSDAAPPALRGAFREEPRHLDLRWARDEAHLDLRHSTFRDGIAQLAAPIHGIPTDELEGEDIRLHRRAVRLRRAAIAGLAVLALVASAAGVVALLNAREADRQAAVALDNEAEALRQRDTALSRQLAAESESAISDGRLDLALLLAVEGYRFGEVSGGPDILHRSTVEAFESLFSSLVQWPQLQAHLHGHAAPVATVALSPDGTRAVSGDEAGTLILWDVASGEELNRAEIGEPPHVLAFSGDGRIVAAGGAPAPDARLHLWDTTGEAPPRIMQAVTPGIDGSIGELALDQTGSLVAAGLVVEDGTVPGLLLLNAAGDEVLWQSDLPEVSDGGFADMTHTAFSPDGLHVLAVSSAGVARFGVADGSVTTTPWSTTGARSTFALSGDGGVLAVAGSETILVFDTVTGEQLDEVFLADASRVALSPDGGHLMGAAVSNGQQLLYRRTVGALDNSAFPVGRVLDVTFSADGRSRAVGGSGNAVVIWDASEVPVPAMRASVPFASDVSPGWVTAAGVAVAGGEVTLTDLASGVGTVIGASGGPVVFNPDGTMLAGGNGPVLVWTLGQSEVAAELEARAPSGEPIMFAGEVAFSPDGALLAASGTTGSLQDESFLVVWSLADRQPITVIPLDFAVEGLAGGVPAYVADLEFDHAGSLLIAASAPAAEGNLSGRIRAWDPRTGEERIDVESDALDVALSPDDATLASAGFQATNLGRVADLGDGYPRLDRGGPDSGGRPSTVAFSQDGSLLAMSFFGPEGATNWIELWDPSSRRRLGLPLHVGREGYVGSMSFDRVDAVENLTWVSGNAAYRLPLDPEAWIETACALAGRNLTPQEWQRHISVDLPYQETC